MTLRPERIVIHHSASDDTHTYNWVQLRHYHVEVKGWRDIGYHWGVEKVDRAYRVHMGRLPTETGAHVRGKNTTSIGVCLVGNFSRTRPPAELLKYAAKFVSWLSLVEGDLPVVGHNELASTECPGKYFDLDRFREMVRAQ